MHTRNQRCYCEHFLDLYLGNDRGVAKRFKALRTAVEKDVGGKAKRVKSTSVVETFRGKVLWDGVVETFEVASDPDVKRCYAFIYAEDNDNQRVATIQEGPKVNSPESAVRAFIASRAQR
jgi:hypothetical protein